MSKNMARMTASLRCGANSSSKKMPPGIVHGTWMIGEVLADSWKPNIEAKRDRGEQIIRHPTHVKSWQPREGSTCNTGAVLRVGGELGFGCRLTYCSRVKYIRSIFLYSMGVQNQVCIFCQDSLTIPDLLLRISSLYWHHSSAGVLALLVVRPATLVEKLLGCESR